MRLSNHSLYDPRRDGRALRVESLSLGRKPTDPARTNYFAVYWIESGAGTFWADTGEHAFGPDCLVFFVPYQRIRFAPKTAVRGQLVQFHANFLCVETFHAEVGCSGTLFSDPYGLPIVTLDGSLKAEIADLMERIRQEQADGGLASDEVSLAYLKVLLILATRMKAQRSEFNSSKPSATNSQSPNACRTGTAGLRHPVVEQLRELIERHYATLHAPSDYARLLHMTAKTLGRCVREQLGKTLTDLVRERILIHAKWELLHTLKPVKQVAGELGFSDELYFSRLFKKATGVAPTFFREFETEIRGGSNLSMLSRHAPIHPRSSQADNTSI